VASVNEAGHPKVRTMVFRRFMSLIQEEDVCAFANEHDYALDRANLLTAVTDLRSDKIAQWRSQALSEVHWYFTKTREQYRLSCSTKVISLEDKKDLSEHEQSLIRQQWRDLSSAAKDGFFVPAPKSALSDTSDDEHTAGRVYGDESIGTKHHESAGDKKPSEDATGTDISPYFGLVLFAPFEVDYLDLKSSPHTRFIYSSVRSKDNALKGPKWQSTPVNP
jgi:hypothetical protein